MSKKRSNAKKDKKVKKTPRISVPDEVFTAGPLRMERHGRFVGGRMDWAPGDHARYMADLAAKYDRVVQEIDALVAQTAEVVARLDPLQLLHRAWWMRSITHLSIEAEVQVGKEQASAMRMVDYVQSVIASTAPSAQKEKLSDEIWIRLQDLVQRIFDRINSSYFLCATAKQRQDAAPIDRALEEFTYLAQLHWCNVTGEQYQNHQVAALRELLSPQSGILESIYGVTSEQLCDELGKIWHALTMGINDARDTMDHFREKVFSAMEVDRAEGLTSGNEADDLKAAVVRHALQPLQERAVGMMVGLDLFDLEKVCTLPRPFLEDFSWSPGEDADFFADGKLKGWPLRVWPTFKRPFLKVDGRFYCFDGSTLFDHFYRQLEKRVFRAGEAYKQRWIEARKQITETLPFDYLRRLLPEAKSFQEIYYYLVESDGRKKRYEADGLLVFDDHLFIVEVKSGAFTYTSPATDAPAHLQSLKNLVGDPAKQGNRLLRYLRGASEVPLLDDADAEVGRIRLSDFRHVNVCAVTLDPFTEIAARIQNLHLIGVEIGNEPVWSLSIDDLRVYADFFTNPLEFLHFVEQRKEAFRSTVLRLDDELDHLGMYLKHNHYAKHVAEMARGKQNAHLQFVGYREEIDKFFSGRLRQQDPQPLHQKMPAGMVRLLTFLARCGIAGRASISSFLLDMAGDPRDTLFATLDQELARLGAGPCRPLSTHGDVRLTAVASSPAHPMSPATLANLRRHALAVIVLNDERDRMFMHVEYESNGSIASVFWENLQSADIPEADLPSLLEYAAAVRDARVRKALASAHVGRNDLCPCGSGRKYKKCCLNR